MVRTRPGRENCDARRLRNDVAVHARSGQHVERSVRQPSTGKQRSARNLAASMASGLLAIKEPHNVSIFKSGLTIKGGAQNIPTSPLTVAVTGLFISVVKVWNFL